MALFDTVGTALSAARSAAPGVYVAFHDQLLAVPGAFKDRDAQTFRGPVVSRPY